MSLRSWLRSLFTRPATRTIRKAPRRARLGLEALEDRAVPATFTVLNTLDDGGAGSLRWAVAQANANAGDDTINFGDGSTSGGANFLDGTAHTIVLTGSQLELTDAATTSISGPGANLLSISGGNLSRVFQVDGPVTASISGLTISGGNAGVSGNGGGLANFGNTTLSNCTISGNTSGVLGGSKAGYGGGVYGAAGSTTTLNDCTVSGDSAVWGGGLYSCSALVLNRCTFNNNSADHGGALASYQGTSTLTDCTFTKNSSTVQGGGPLFYDGSATLTNCNISNNNASRAGGVSVLDATVQLVNCTVSGNAATTTHGGGLYNFRGNMTLTNCTISGNSAPGTPGAPGVGGGLISYGGQTTLTNCTVSGNSAGWGGGLHATQTTVNMVNSTVSGNTATGTGDGGGGVADDRSNVTLTNCTLNGNSGSNGGGLWLSGTSSSAFATATLVNCTVSGNTANYGGGLYRGFHATLSLGNTIVAGNTATKTGPDVNAPVNSLGHNLIGKADSSIGWISGSDMWGTIAAPLNPLLAPLGTYGGPTQTMPLLPGSPALDAGQNTLVAGITTDQRGFARTVNSTVDIGAFESSGFTITVVSGSGQTTNTNSGFQDLAVLVTANNALEPVAGGLVNFTAPTKGASAILSATTVTIDATGKASVSAKANGTAGSYTVTATARGITNSALFSLTNKRPGK
jgi:hypothetical protein